MVAGVAAVALSACGAAGAAQDGAGVPSAGAATAGDSGDVDTVEPAVPEDPDAVEDAAAGGGDAVAIEVAGLPVGSDTPLARDGTWCFPLAWSGLLDAGTVVEIHTVRVGEPGGTLRDEPCGGRPPCEGARLTAGAGGCSLLITPTSPDVTGVEVALDATVRCTERAACDAVRGSDAWTWLAAPTVDPGAGPGAGDDAPGDDADGW